MSVAPDIDPAIFVAPYTTLVLSSGGIRGIAIAGAVGALGSAGMLDKVKTYIGTSAGSIIAMLLAVGYTAEEVTHLSAKVDLWTTLGATIGLRNLMLVPKELGLIDTTGKLRNILRLLVERSRVGRCNPDLTFAQVFDRTGVRLVVCAANISNSNPIYFDNASTPNMRIEKAVRASCAIPLVFMPVDDMFVDGAIVDHFPIAASTDNEKSTLGVCIVDSNKSDISRTSQPRHSFDRLLNYGYALVRTMEKMQMKQLDTKYSRNTITIECPRGQSAGKKAMVDMLVVGKKAGLQFINRVHRYNNSRRSNRAAVADAHDRPMGVECLIRMINAKRTAACLLKYGAATAWQVQK